MILNDTPQNEAILSNVGEIGEFRIRNSAKAFNILSSGLYANKIRAIIRELSCNAVDSHTAAGNAGTPFDVHLPNNLEPYFSIRDYGTGLTHDQVTSIYTTYFESTKTDSNDYIGALGLGSKSPFSYTDNFTVTAVKDGRKGIYSAFINGQGVPSIALMMEEETTDPSGVEVKFSVNDRYDFSKFRDEARRVYTYFTLRPVVSGCNDFEFRDVVYETENIIPGVSAMQNEYCCVAVMGNIAYPVDVPNETENLGSVSRLTNCGLEMRFEIGELDFQASREGLSYIPSTIEAIKRKLEAVNARLAIHVAEEANKIDNLWERAQYLTKKADSGMWNAAVIKYVADTKFDLVVNHPGTSYVRMVDAKLFAKDLAKDFNIQLSGFTKSRGNLVCSVMKPSHEYDQTVTPAVALPYYIMTASKGIYFVVTDTKVGALERAKFHWRKAQPQGDHYSHYVFVLSAVDSKKPMDTKGFFDLIKNPPADHIMTASSLTEKPRKASTGSGIGKDVTILRLEERGTGGYYTSKEMVWRDAGKADSFDSNQTYYYLPLKGFEVMTDKLTISDVKNFNKMVLNSGISEFANTKIYGVRKGDLGFIKTQKNWVNIQDKLLDVFSKLTNADVAGFAQSELDLGRVFTYNTAIVSKVDVDSVYTKFVTKLKDVPVGSFNRDCFVRLNQMCGGKVYFDRVVNELKDEFTVVRSKYPLLKWVSGYSIDYADVAEYINLIDNKEVK